MKSALRSLTILTSILCSFNALAAEELSQETKNQISQHRVTGDAPSDQAKCAVSAAKNEAKQDGVHFFKLPKNKKMDIAERCSKRTGYRIKYFERQRADRLGMKI